MAKKKRREGWLTRQVKGAFGGFQGAYDRAVDILDLPPRVGVEAGWELVGRFYDTCEGMAPNEWKTPEDFDDSHMPWKDPDRFHEAIKQGHFNFPFINFTWLLLVDPEDKGGMPKLRGLMQRAKPTKPELPMYGSRSG